MRGPLLVLIFFTVVDSITHVAVKMADARICREHGLVSANRILNACLDPKTSIVYHRPSLERSTD